MPVNPPDSAAAAILEEKIFTPSERAAVTSSFTARHANPQREPSSKNAVNQVAAANASTT